MMWYLTDMSKNCAVSKKIWERTHIFREAHDMKRKGGPDGTFDNTTALSNYINIAKG